MSTKIDLREVFVEHFATLRNYATNETSIVDIAVFYVLPAIVATIIFWMKIDLGPVSIGIIIGALAILAGLLINVLVLLYTVNETAPTVTETNERRGLIKEVNANLLYEITIAVFAIVLLCGLRILKGLELQIGTAIVIFITGNFVLTLLMVVKRLKVLLGLRFG